MHPTTRKYPRTMEEAFGPGHRGNVWEPYPPMSKGDKLFMWALAVCCVAFLVVVFLYPEAKR